MVPVYDGDLGCRWAYRSTPALTVEELRGHRRRGPACRWPRRGATGRSCSSCYERLVEAQTVAPTFYTDFPVDVSPLTREHRDDPRLAERWDLVAFGTELGTAYTELVDPVEQRRAADRAVAAGGGR